MRVSARDFRKAMGCFATGVTVITVDQEGEVHGMTANAFTAVSLDPVLVLVCVDHRARTHAHLHARKRFGVNVLRSDQQAISEYYARRRRLISIRKRRAPASIAPRRARRCCKERWRTWNAGCTRRKPAGDHTIFIAEVEEVVVRDGEPLLYFRSQYRELTEVRWSE